MPTLTPKAPSGSWSPVIGPRTAAFVKKKTSGANAMSELTVDKVIEEASDILSHCVCPVDQAGSNAVLVVGYVQSGKTLSFTTVTSLARDNGFGIVIVLAGTTNSLKGQSEDRLEKDLGLEDLQRDWRHFNNPDLTGSYFDDIKQTLANWDRHRQGRTKEEKPAVLVTVLKQAQRLGGAAAVLSELKLAGIPALIIDDESDQAGLNTKAHQNLLKGTADESGVYEAIVALRTALPLHSYLQYTATPQANLLLAATDVLDPSFAKVISAGDGYTGGKTFFQDRRNELIVRVPDTEIFTPASPFPEPPAQLQEALRIFLLGIAAGAGSDGRSNRSMMVQAHQNTAPHALYAKWIRSLLSSWSAAFETENSDIIVELKEEFLTAFKSLSSTVPDLPPLDELLELAAEKIPEIRVVVVNSTAEAEKNIKWSTWEYWILVGGQKLDRGFTVEGLTVTYMPRPVSANADVLQQRARFFGYKAGYINYCRVFLVADSISAFSGYVDDEEYLRQSLRDHEGQPLKEWKRDFILHRQLVRPTRAGVVGRATKRLPLARGWTWPKSMHIGSDAIKNNASAFADLRQRAEGHLVDSSLIPGVVDSRASGVRNPTWLDAPLNEIVEFLISLHLSANEDSLQMTAIEMALGRHLAQYPDSLATVVFMADLQVADGGGRNLDVLRGNIFVGMSPNGASGEDVIYSGDRGVFSEENVTLQLRTVRLSSPAAPEGQKYAAVPWLAVHFPTTIANDAWLEDV